MAEQATKVTDPAAYLEHALDYIEQHSVRRRHVDWPAFRAQVRARAAGASTIADTYPAIRHGLALLGDRHSGFSDPEQMARARARLQTGGYIAERRPQGRVVAGRFGYVELPSATCRDQETCGPYAEEVQRIIRELDEAGVGGWSVDLRRNPGGNMWPTIAGIGPVLGEGECGAFVDPGGGRMTWGYAYAAGASNVGGRRRILVEEPYRLRTRTGPVPVAVLAGPKTKSSGEFTLLAFRGRPDTRTFGEPTFGVPTSNSGHILPDGSMLNLTEHLGADRTGQTHDGPIPPDEPVPIDWEKLGQDDDPVILAGVSWLRQGR